MRLQYSELTNGIRLIKLHGALDALGTSRVEVEFVRCCAGDNVCVLVDLSKVNYISSIGLPLLINSAKSVARHGGKLALLKPQRAVENILELTGIPLIIPTYSDLESATEGLTGLPNA
ncbi:MAG TPA: STAS domain-containing protein [Anaerolineales bacterium]|nr:STAS domain-containing protein [Anaerolineales bacterium]